MTSADTYSPLDTKRADSVVSMLGLLDEDAKAIKDVLPPFRRQLEQLNSEGRAIAQAQGHDHDAKRAELAAKHELRESLLRTTISTVNSRLSPLGAERLRSYVQFEKRRMKLFPLPDMSRTTRIGRLLSLRTVSAQMSPSGATYTSNSLIDDPYTPWVSSAAITDASSSCYCHSSSAQSTVYLNGRSGVANGGGGELAYVPSYLPLIASDYLSTSQVEGTSTHTSYCPIAGATFIDTQTAQFSRWNLFRRTTGAPAERAVRTKQAL